MPRMAEQHGSTPAAWTAVVLCLVGFTVGGIGLVAGPSWLVFWIGLGMILVAPLVGKVMASTGLGEDPR